MKKMLRAGLVALVAYLLLMWLRRLPGLQPGPKGLVPQEPTPGPTPSPSPKTPVEPPAPAPGAALKWASPEELEVDLVPNHTTPETILVRRRQAPLPLTPEMRAALTARSQSQARPDFTQPERQQIEAALKALEQTIERLIYGASGQRGRARVFLQPTLDLTDPKDPRILGHYQIQTTGYNLEGEVFQQLEAAIDRAGQEWLQDYARSGLYWERLATARKGAKQTTRRE